MRRFLPLLLLLLCTDPGHTATYCVDMDNGNDNNTGTATGANCTGTVSAWLSPSKTADAAAGDTILYKCGTSADILTDSHRPTIKANQTHGAYGSCTGSNPPTFVGTNWSTSVTQGVLRVPSTSMGVTLWGLRVSGSSRNCVTTSANNTDMRSLVLNNCTNQSLATSRQTDGSETQNIRLTNSLIGPATKLATICQGVVGSVAQYNTFQGVVSDPTYACFNSLNTGAQHEFAYNIVRENLASNDRALLSVAVDGTGSGALYTRNVWLHHNVLYTGDGAGFSLPLFSHAGDGGIPNEQKLYNVLLEFNTLVGLDTQCLVLDDGRTPTDITDMGLIRWRNNLCLDTGQQGVTLRDDLALTENTHNAYAAGETFSGTTAGTNAQVASTADLVSSGTDWNLVAGSVLLGAASNGTHIGALQSLTLDAGAATVETATPNTVCLTWNTIAPIADIVQGAESAATYPGCTWSGESWLQVGGEGSPRANASCTIQNGNQTCIGFSGAALTSGQTATLTIPAGRIAAGQIGSALATGMQRHKNIAYSAFAVVNNVDTVPPPSLLRILTQIRWAAGGQGLLSTTAHHWKGTANATGSVAVPVMPAAALLLAVQIQATGESTPVETYKLQCRVNGGAAFDVTETSTPVALTDGGPGIGHLTPISTSLFGTPTIRAGYYLTASTGFPAQVLAEDALTEFAWSVRLADSLTDGETLACVPVRSDGTALDSYPLGATTPTAIVRTREGGNF